MLERYFLSRLKLKQKNQSQSKGEEVAFIVGNKSRKISKIARDNINELKNILNQSADIVEKEVRFNNGQKAELLFIDGLVDNNMISDTILRPLAEDNMPKFTGVKLLNHIEKGVLCANDITKVTTTKEVAEACLKGDTVIFVSTCTSALIINTKGGERRAVTEPLSESVVRGPREGFTENFRVNTALIRRKICNGNLKVEQFKIGKKSQTSVSLIYLSQVAKQEIVDNVKKRLQTLNVESILESGYIEQYIEDNPFSPFSTIDYTEKPDVVAAKILEGRIALIVDGTPFVLTLPMLFIESFQTAEDYYERPLYSSIIRIFRYFAYFVSVFGPAIYVALANFHQELIPTTLLLSIIKSKEGTPFPIFIETLIMVFVFEFLREAGIRLPRSVGQAVSIVGALVMGEAAVSAGIVGAPIVIVVAFTAVCGFMLPRQNNSSAILRIVMLLLASFVGVFGVMIGFLALLYHLASIESFGVPYFDSFSNNNDLKDTIVRMPLWLSMKRPANLAGKDKTRVNFFVPPNIDNQVCGQDGESNE